MEVLKTDLETGEPLAGAVIGLYADEAVRNAKGAVIAAQGTLLESSETGTDGLAVFESDLPFGFRYAVREISAPNGYLVSEDKQTFSFDNADGVTGTTQVRLSITDQPNDVKIEVDKAAPEQIQEQEKFLYTVEKIRNTGNCSVDNFTLTDILPSQVELTELWTGTRCG